MENQEKKNLPKSPAGSDQLGESENPTSTDSSRSEIDATHGEDAIEIEMNEAERLGAMNTFAPMDGELGDESEDYGDLPVEERNNRNVYDPSLSTGGKSGESNNERPEGIHVSRAFQAGISFKDNDSYLEEGIQSDKKQKANRADKWEESEATEQEDET